jgi:uncharacterized protein YbcV (DUF1398 family)
MDYAIIDDSAKLSFQDTTLRRWRTNSTNPGIKASIRAVQHGEIGYAEFLRQIIQAGCSTYMVFLQGRKVIYFGQDGAFHIEKFPDRAP